MQGFWFINKYLRYVLIWVVPPSPDAIFGKWVGLPWDLMSSWWWRLHPGAWGVVPKFESWSWRESTDTTPPGKTNMASWKTPPSESNGISYWKLKMVDFPAKGHVTLFRGLFIHLSLPHRVSRKKKTPVPGAIQPHRDGHGPGGGKTKKPGEVWTTFRGSTEARHLLGGSSQDGEDTWLGWVPRLPNPYGDENDHHGY